MPEAPTISVIIPTYKHAQYVATTIESVLNQTIRGTEIIVVNDGSPDNTDEVLQPYVSSGAIRYVRQPNAGQASARNRGIDLARGEYIALLDDDDLWPVDKLEWQVAALTARPEKVLAFGTVHPFSDSPSLGSPTEPDLATTQFRPECPARRQFLHRNWIVSPGQTLIRKSALARIGGFAPDIWGVDDYDLYIRLAAVGDFHFEPRQALFYRRHADNASRDLERMYANLQRVHRKHWSARKVVSSPLLWVRSIWYLRRYTFERLFAESKRAVQEKDFNKARRHLRRAATIFPPCLLRRSFVRMASSLVKPA